MLKRKILKQILTVYLSVLMLLFLNEGIVKASLQSNPNTQYKKQKTAEDWMSEFRNMETKGETMGLSEVLNEDLTALSESNNIDIHLIRTTEYGATAILSASAYGNPSNENKMTTTTGNDTGVIRSNDRQEGTAGGLDGIFAGTNARYYDTYTTNINSARVGDALGNDKTDNPGCYRWHTTTTPTWVSNVKPYFVSGYYGLFGFFSYGYSNTPYARGVVVCGTEI